MKKLRITGYGAFLVNGMLAVMTGAIITYLVNDYGISQAAAGRMVSAQSMGNLVMVLLSGFVIQLVGRKKALLLFPVMFGAGFGGILFSSNEAVLYVLFAITGLGWGLCNNILNIIMMESGGGISILYTCYAAGSFLGPFFVTAITAMGLSWKTPVLIVALASFMLIPGFASVSKENLGAEAEKGIDKKDFGFLRKPRYYVCNLLYFGYIGVEVAINSWIITYLTDSGFMSDKLSQTMLSFYWLIIIFVRLFVGKYMKKFKRENILLVQWIGLFLGLMGLMNTEGHVGGIIMLVIMAIFMGAISPVNAENADEFIKGKGISGGIMFAVGCGGSAVLPMVVGSLADTKSITAGMGVVLMVMAVMIAVSVINKCMKKPVK